MPPPSHPDQVRELIAFQAEVQNEEEVQDHAQGSHQDPGHLSHVQGQEGAAQEAGISCPPAGECHPFR